MNRKLNVFLDPYLQLAVVMVVLGGGDGGGFDLSALCGGHDPTSISGNRWKTKQREPMQHSSAHDTPVYRHSDLLFALPAGVTPHCLIEFIKWFQSMCFTALAWSGVIRSRYNYMLRETPKVKAEARNGLIYYDYVIRDQDTVLQQIPIVSYCFFFLIW